MSEREPGTLKLVVAWSERRNLCSLIADVLAAIAGDDDVIRLTEEAHVVWTDRRTEDVRDAVSGALQEGENVLVAEFETWSAGGPVVNADWLRLRGH